MYLLRFFEKLTDLKLVYFDLKLENIVAKLNNDLVTDIKIIDIDPVFCISYEYLFDYSNTECGFDIEYINGAIIALYKQICYKRSVGILFFDNENIEIIYKNLLLMTINSPRTLKKINYMYKSIHFKSDLNSDFIIE